MYACYIDESGHCGKKYDPRQPVEVVSGVLIDLTKLFKTQREHKLLIEYLNMCGIPLKELKASDIYAGRKHWDGVSPLMRDRFFIHILKWMSKRFCKIIPCPIDCETFFNKKRSGCHLSRKLCYPYEVGALNIILGIQRAQQSKKYNKDKTFLIFDEQKGHDMNLIKILETDLSFTDSYTKFGSVKEKERLFCIVDVPYFSKSHLAVVIQLADVISFVINKYFLLRSYRQTESYNGELEKITSWYKMIGNNLIGHTSIDPPGRDNLCEYYKSIRPPGWSAKEWLII